MAELRIAPGVLEDLESIVKWYELRSVDAAGRFCQEMDEALDCITRSPRQFAKWSDQQRYFLLPHFPYYVIYRVDGNVVTVSTIRHTARDVQPLE